MMCWEDERLLFHRCDARFNRSTVTLKNEADARLVEQCQRVLGVVAAGGGVFVIKHDTESTLQRIEQMLAEKDDFDAAMLRAPGRIVTDY